MRGETLSIRNRSAIGRFPSGTLELDEPKNVEPEKKKWTCSSWIQQCCCCRRKKTDDVTETVIPNPTAEEPKESYEMKSTKFNRLDLNEW